MKKLLLASLIALSGSTFAAQTAIGPVVPTSWRVENYTPGSVILWFTGSNCGASQQLTLPASATTADHSRLYATVMAAKAGNLKMFVFYDNAVAGCPISSYGIQ